MELSVWVHAIYTCRALLRVPQRPVLALMCQNMSCSPFSWCNLTVGPTSQVIMYNSIVRIYFPSPLTGDDECRIEEENRANNEAGI